MSVKDAALMVMPRSVEHFVREALYKKNCRLDLSEYRTALEKWHMLSTGRTCDLDSPTSLGDKIQWLKLYDSTELKGRLADKYLVREWVSQQAGSEYLIPMLGVWDDADKIPLGDLPDAYVLKATHGSGWNIIVDDSSTIDEKAVRRRLAKWLSTREAMTGGFELHYEFCEPRIIAEQYISDSSNGLRDYKFVCIEGEVQFILAVEGRFQNLHSCTYYPDWSRTPFSYGYKMGYTMEIDRPSCLDEMLRLAEVLSKDLAFVRVDLYEADGKVYFGEMTFTPANGLSAFVPDSYALEYGAKLHLPAKKAFKGTML